MYQQSNRERPIEIKTYTNQLEMKKLFTLLLTAGIAVGAFAQTEKVSIKQTATTKVAVLTTEIPEGAIVVKIKNEAGDLILRDRILKTEKFTKSYDLANLEKGTFIIEVSGATGTLASSQVENFIAEKPAVFSRLSKMDDNTFRLLVSNLDSKNVEVLIYDGGRLIHTETVDNPQGLHKIFKVEQPSAEGISFKVKTASGFEGYVSGE